MAVSTWELHYKAPRYPADLQFMLGYLEVLKSSYTTLAIDYDQDEDGSIHVMVGDVRTFKDVMRGLHTFGPHKITVLLDGEAAAPYGLEEKIPVRSRAVLDEAGDGDSESSLELGT